VPGIRSTLIASDDVDVFAQVINNFSFSFIAPLGTEYDLNGHGIMSLETERIVN
jgi:hypothetical protein